MNVSNIVNNNTVNINNNNYGREINKKMSRPSAYEQYLAETREQDVANCKKVIELCERMKLSYVSNVDSPDPFLAHCVLVEFDNGSKMSIQCLGQVRCGTFCETMYFNVVRRYSSLEELEEHLLKIFLTSGTCRIKSVEVV